MGVTEIYSSLDLVVRGLAAIGWGDWSLRLREAVRAGSTSGEILMAVRWILKELKKEGSELPGDLDRTIDRVLVEIDRTGI